MVTAALVMVCVATSPQLALDRLSNFLKRIDTVSVDLKVSTIYSPAVGTGRFLMDRPSRARFELKYGGEDYTFVNSEKGILELEKSQKLYTENPPLEKLLAPASRLSAIPNFAFPVMFLSNDVRALVQLEEPEVEENVLMNGVLTDHVWAGDPGGESEFHAYVAKDGRPVRIFIKMTDAGGPKQAQTDFSNWKVNEPLSDDSFALSIPRGFIPASLPREPYTFLPGESLPLSGWASKSGEALKAHKGFYILVAPDCGPSEALGAKLGSFPRGAPVSILSTDAEGDVPTSFSGRPVYVHSDPFNSLRAPGTPLVFLTDAKGIVVKVWYGWDREIPTSMLKDLASSYDRATQ